MTTGVLSNPKRWQAFADAVALALGINVWVSVVVLPGFFVGSWQSGVDVLAGMLPLVMLAAGLWRRSEVLLLLAFPSALLVPISLSPEMVSAYVYGLARFIIVSIGLVAYLLGISFFTSFYEPLPPVSSRPLASSRRPIPPRWRRRFRIYRILVVLSVIFPATLLHAANFDDSVQAFLRQMFPGRVRQMTTVVNLAIITSWVLLFGRCFLGVLQQHRTGDRALTRELGRIQSDSQRGRPRLAFFVGVVFAIGFMMILLFSRYM